MAVHATTVEDSRIGSSTGREVASREQIVGVAETSELVVALVAEKRSGRDEKPLVVRPVRVVAGKAVFDDRGVLPEKRPALFGVTLVTELIDAIGAQQRVGRRTVRRVTIAAGDLAFGQRHVGALSKLRALLGVTAETGLRDILLREQPPRRLLGHRVVAIAASDRLPLMRRSAPVDARATRVTFEAHPVHGLDARRGLARERDDPTALGRGFRVLGPGPVATLATGLVESVARSLRQARMDSGRPVVGLDDMTRATAGLTDVAHLCRVWHGGLRRGGVWRGGIWRGGLGRSGRQAWIGEQSD